MKNKRVNKLLKYSNAEIINFAMCYPYLIFQNIVKIKLNPNKNILSLK